MNSPNDNVHSVNILVDQNKDLINSCGHKGGNGVHLNTKSTKPLITNDDLKCTPVLNKCFKCSKQSSNCDECVGKTESCNISPSDCSVKVPSCCDNQDLILQTNQPHSYEQCCPVECLSGDKLACELKSLNFSDEVDTLNPTFARDSDTSEHIVSAINGICYARYSSELQMPAIMHLITKDLSEPYSIYTYRYFIHNWPQLCYLAIHKSQICWCHRMQT
uniref:Uncharacterized protein n=1 Tax=Ciona savignyi TaxID=51511 RepID=H2Z7V3_CIOSA